MSEQKPFLDEDLPDVQRLLDEGVAAARAGNKDFARQLFEEVVTQDEGNESGWYYLAVVIEDPAIRIECLQMVLTINPENERARTALAKLGGAMPEPAAVADEPAAETVYDEDADDAFAETGDSNEGAEAAEFDESEDEEKSGPTNRFALETEIIPGITRRMVTLSVAGLLALVMITCCMGVMILNNNNRKAQNATATAIALQVERQATQAAATAIRQETDIPLTETAAFLPTPTRTPAVTLPPTWTPIPSATPDMSGATATPLATAVGSGLFSGNILAASGEDRVGEGYVPLVQIPLDGSASTFQFFDDRAAAPVLSPRGDLMAYTRYSTATREQGIELRWMDNSQEPQLLTTLLGNIILRDQEHADFSPDGGKLAFAAAEGGNQYRDIFVVDLAQLFQAYEDASTGAITAAEISQRALTKLTRSTVDSYAPSWGDANRLVIVQDTSMVGGGVDLKVLNVNGTLTDVTTDGNAFVENNPQIAPDGLRVVFDAYSAMSPGDVDIYIMALSGGVPLLQVTNDTIDTNPIWSDDGNFIVYASDRARNGFEIFILEVGTGANYQVTVNEVYDMPGDWIPAE